LPFIARFWGWKSDFRLKFMDAIWTSFSRTCLLSH
jgi:hypothetical protein